MRRFHTATSQALAIPLSAFILLHPVFGRSSARTPPAFTIRLNPDEAVLHALNRLSFGACPGDVARVRAMGLKKWIALQLHPERIPENPLLAAKLAPFTSLNLPPDQLAQLYPLPGEIRAMAEGRQPLPAEPLARAAVERLIARVKARQSKEAPGDNEDAPVRLADVLPPDQIAVLRTGTAAQKQALLSGVPQAKFQSLAEALPRPLRQSVIPFAPPELRRAMVYLNAPEQVLAYDLSNAKLLRAIYGNRQLAEVLDDFWFNHFNVFYDKGPDRILTGAYEQNAIRPHVLGHFRDLLEATAKSPAMLVYLDNFQSVRADLDAKAPLRRARRGLNENYARELMELHTLGVNGGYTQNDVIEVARCFTGWTVRDPQKGGGFFYNDKVHDKGQKIVLGQMIPAGGGIEDGEKVLDILAAHPSTARHISLELAQRFVADDPPAALAERMAKRFLETHGDIRETLQAMLDSKEFWSQGAYRAKIKTPFEMVVSAVRALNADVEDGFTLATQLNQLGEPLYRKLEPTGYSNLNAEWISSAALLGRMNFAVALASNKLPGVAPHTSIESADQEQIARELLGAGLSPGTRAVVDNALKEQASAAGLVSGLILGSPDFQKR